MGSLHAPCPTYSSQISIVKIKFNCNKLKSSNRCSNILQTFLPGTECYQAQFIRQWYWKDFCVAPTANLPTLQSTKNLCDCWLTPNRDKTGVKSTEPCKQNLSNELYPKPKNTKQQENICTKTSKPKEIFDIYQVNVPTPILPKQWTK